MGLLDGIVGAGLGFLGQERANRANKKLMREQMAFQERMSNTAHQRQVEDLRAAGLNPILSAKYGGASTPAGALARMENSAKNVSQDYNARQQTAAAVNNVKQDTALKGVQTTQTAESIENIKAETQLKINNARGVDINNQMQDLLLDAYKKMPAARIIKEMGVLPGGASWLSGKMYEWMDQQEPLKIMKDQKKWSR